MAKKNKIKTKRRELIEYLTNRGKNNSNEEDSEIEFKGDDNDGMFFLHDGQGNYCSAAWDTAAVVVMAYHHESPNVKDEEDYPEMEIDWDGLPGFPDQLKALAEKAFDSLDIGPTVGLWTENESVVTPFPLEDSIEYGLYMIGEILK